MKDDEETTLSHMAPNEHASRLQEALALLEKTQLSSQDIDQIRDLIELSDYALSPDLLFALRQLDNLHSTAVKANQNLSAGSSLLSEMNSKEKEANDLHQQISSNKVNLNQLPSELEDLKKQRADLEEQLRQINSQITDRESRLSTLPSSIQSSQDRLVAVIKENKQLKQRLVRLSLFEEEDKKALVDFEAQKNNVIHAVKALLNV